MVLVQKRPVFNLFSLGNLGQENMFYNILNGKKKLSFYAIKTRSLKSGKLRFFQRGYSMILVLNWPIFHGFSLVNQSEENVFYAILN